jgi:hypothetical protein
MNTLRPDELSALCSQMDSAAQICKLSSTCKAMNKFFASKASKNAWQAFVKNMCGYEIVDGGQSLRYRAMITLCPYLANPEIYRVNFNSFTRFEVAASKKDGSTYLWCEKGSESLHIQLSGNSKRVESGDLVFQPKPRMSDNGTEQVAEWAQIHPESELSSTFFSFHHDPNRKVMQIHNSLFVACVISKVEGQPPHHARGKRILVFFTKTGDESIRVLYTIRAYTEEIEEDHIASFVAFDRARLCVRTNLMIVKYYGPGRVHTWQPDPTVALRRLFAGEPNSFQLTNVVRFPDQVERVTNWPIMRSVLEARNYEASRKLLNQVKDALGGRPAQLLFTEESGRSMLFTAVKTGNVDIVRFILENGGNVNTTYREKGFNIISHCMNYPDIAPDVVSQITSDHLDREVAYSATLEGVRLCEPIVHLLKNRQSAALKDGEFRDDLIKGIITRYVAIDDPGLLVMNARFIRALLLEGEPPSEEKQHIFLSYALKYNHLYMATFLASMGMRLEEHGDWCINFIPEPARTDMKEALARIYHSSA